MDASEILLNVVFYVLAFAAVTQVAALATYWWERRHR